MLDQKIIDEISEQYGAVGRLRRRHLRGRLARCPYDEIAAELPPEGNILDYGCGYGHFAVYLHLLNRSYNIFGVDPDGRKISVAESAATVIGSGQLSFFQTSEPVFAEAPKSFDAAVILDVLYLMPQQQQQRVLERIAASLRPGGVVVIKAIDLTRGTETRRAVFQEWLMVRLFRLTYSPGPYMAAQPQSWYVDLLSNAGLACTYRPMPGLKTPAILIVGKKKIGNGGE